MGSPWRAAKSRTARGDNGSPSFFSPSRRSPSVMLHVKSGTGFGKKVFAAWRMSARMRCSSDDRM
jgi:hypothetical protein